jgi:hypothetical protein
MTPRFRRNLMLSSSGFPFYLEELDSKFTERLVSFYQTAWRHIMKCNNIKNLNSIPRLFINKNNFLHNFNRN